MALLFVEGFDHEAIADVGRKWGVATGSVSIQAGRFGNGCQMNDDNGRYIEHTAIPTPGDVFFIGFAYWWSGAGDNSTFFRFLEGSTTHVDLRLLNSTGQIQVCRNGTTLGTSSAAIPLQTWRYIELGVTIHDTAGVAIVRIDEVVEINLSSIDTKNGGTGVVDRMRFNGQGGFGSGNYRIDDVYLCDDAGSINNTFLGDCRVHTLLPDNNGNYSDFDGSDGNSTNNYQLVDETTPDDDTTYVEETTAGSKDSYSYSTYSPTSGTIMGVQQSTCARKTDAGTRKFRHLARLSGTNSIPAVDKTMDTTYKIFTGVHETKPGGGAWSNSDVNNAEFGYELQ